MSANQKNLVDQKIPTVTCRHAIYQPRFLERGAFPLKMLSVDGLSEHAERGQVKLKYLNIIKSFASVEIMYAMLSFSKRPFVV